ncbi:MAG: hypothetical protein H6681_03420 [Desulfobacteraceae bacterium]|nr:hypothetical protein [Desulfobacteraceae bacterium]MCB9494479.1 hypothetical protein [Desulfobacteraceae bacterium]
MSDKKNKKQKSKSEELKERKEALQALPKTIREKLSEEEVNIFLHKEVWPESLFEKLSDFIFPPEK